MTASLRLDPNFNSYLKDFSQGNVTKKIASSTKFLDLLKSKGDEQVSKPWVVKLSANSGLNLCPGFMKLDDLRCGLID